MNRSHTLLNRLPHRYPFLMLDGIEELEPGKWAKGFKNVTLNEWYMTETQLFMPHMLIVEALAQLGAFTVDAEQTGLGFLTSIKGTEFLGTARPGDRIDLYYEVVRQKAGFRLGKGHAAVNGEMIVRADEIMAYQAGR